MPAYPAGVPDAEAAALNAVLQERLGVDSALDVLRRLASDGLLSERAARALIPEDEQIRQVSAKLVLGGWPLGGSAEDEDEAPPREGSPLAGSSTGCARGTPAACPSTTTSRSWPSSSVASPARRSRRSPRRCAVPTSAPRGPRTSRPRSARYTHTDPSETDLRRVRDQLAKKGWPVEFPDPDLP